MRRGGLLAAAAVIVVTNGVVLLEVARNRAGGAVETIQLTERELPLNSRAKEDTGVAVRLDWQRFNFDTNEYSWLDRTKLEGLGFDYARALRDPRRPPLPRPAFAALEFEGPAWEKLRDSGQQINPQMRSRLFPVDVASAPEPLLQKYPDRGRYLIVRAVVQLSVNPRDARLQPLISEVLPDTIHVPPPLSDALGGLPSVPNITSPRYTLALSYGRHFEPWLVGSAPTQ